MKKLLFIFINKIKFLIQKWKYKRELYLMNEDIISIDLPIHTLPSKECIKKYNNKYIGQKFFCESENEFYMYTGVDGDEYIKIHSTLK
jgi:hypothetical protein